MSAAGVPPSEEQKRRLRLRLSVLDAYLLAAERRADVMDVVAEARDQDEARRSVARLLDISEDAASGVLDLRLRRFTQTGSQRFDLKAKTSETSWIEDADLGQRSGVTLRGWFQAWSTYPFSSSLRASNCSRSDA